MASKSEAQVPGDALRSAYDLATTQEKDPKTSLLKIGGPLVGVSVSQGHPKGELGAVKAERAKEKALDKAFSPAK